MGSQSDWETMKEACNILNEFEIPFEAKVVSAHRTPHFMVEYASTAQDQGAPGDYRWCWRCGSFAGDGGRLYAASRFRSSPFKVDLLQGLDSLLSIVQNARWHPCCYVSNWSRWSQERWSARPARILGLNDVEVRTKMDEYMASQTQSVLENQNLI